jgi:serine/threonine protein kinase
MADDKIGSYKILKQMGAGGMAKVYLAVHEDVPNLKVVLKILDDPLLGERFIQEADKLALLDGHPSVCRIKHFFRHGDKTAIAMEFIDGETLDQRLKSQGQFEFDEAVRICADVLDTLHFAHRKGIFHRDIKPGNVMIDSRGNVKVIDFGIAKAKTDPDLTRAGTCCGTPGYMSPEQFTPNEDTNYALADIYAVGTMLFKLLTGQLPFPGDNEFAIRDAKLFNEAPKPSSLRKGIPKHVEQAILKAMQREPENRFQSAMEMREALLKAGAPSKAVVKPAPRSEEATMEVVGKGGATPPPTPRPVKKSRMPLVIGAAAVVVVAALAVIFWPSESLPGAPDPRAPLDQLLIDNTNRPTFTWAAATDSKGTYELEYSVDSEFTSPVRLQGLKDTVFAMPQSLANADYWWRVRAVNGSGEAGPYSTVRNFTIDVALPQGSLRVGVNRPSDIYVNGELAQNNATRYEATLDTGTYEVRVENSGSNEKRLSENLAVLPDQTTRRDFRFTFPQSAPPEPPKPTTGKLAVLSVPPGAAIFVDGQPQADVYTPHTLTVKPGRRQVKVVLLGEEERTMESGVEVKSGADNNVMFNFEQDTVLVNF